MTSQGQDLIDRVVRLQKTVQRAFQFFVGFFVFTFVYFTAVKIHEQHNELHWSEILIRFVFLVFAISLAATLTRQIRKQFLTYVQSVQARELNLSFREQSKTSLLSNLSEGILEYDIGSKQWMTVTTPFLSIFRLDWFKFMRETQSESNISSWYSLVHPDDLIVAKSMIERRLESTGVDRCQLRMINNLSEIRTVDVGLASIIESANQGILIISHRDITEVRRAEHQRQLLTSIVEDSPDAFWIFDDEGTNLYTSVSATKIMDRARKYQCRELDFMHDSIALKAQLLVHLNPGEHYKRIIQPRCNAPANDPLPKFALLSGFTVESQNHQNYHVVAVKDISDAYQRELEVKSLKDRMELALGAANIGVWEWDLNSHLMSWDSHLYDLFELNPQLKPSYEFILSKIHPDDLTAMKTLMADVIERRSGFNVQFRVMSSNDSILHIKGIGQLVYLDPSGSEQGHRKMFGIFWDVTKEMIAREELAQSQLRQQNSARLAALGEMASGVAHEINNPLTIISARAALLKAKLKNSAGQEPTQDYQIALESIESNVVRISKIIKGLRTFSRDGEKDPFQPHHLSQLVEDTLGICSERFRTQDVKLEIINDCEPHKYLTCRGVQIAQVMVNLINNAFDASSDSDQKEIQVKIFEDDEGTHFLVKDSGPGVPHGLELKIMQPFFTTKEVGKGTGLGLSISQAIVRDHQGRLFVDRSVSSSCFHFVIPRLSEVKTLPRISS